MSGPEDALFEWLVDGAPGMKTAPEIAERLAVGLGAAGVPIDRMMIFVTTLHPTILGRAFRWSRGEGLQTLELNSQIQSSDAFQKNPLAEVTRTRKPIRRRLDDSLAATDFPVLHDLRAEGFTDYICEPLVFTNGETHAVTIATRTPSGFDTTHVAMIHRVLRPLARVAEIYALQRVASNLLSTYVGRNCGDRILAGRILRGDVETLRAVIWFSDLRGFTEMSSSLTPREIIDILNELFECQVPAIEKHGGEVLKFIGDGLLGIFPLGEDGPESRLRLDRVAPAWCAAALAASADAFAALDARNEKAKVPLRFGLALHIGEIAYGNIGGASRLDFTAIGPAVNVASRLEGLTGKLDRRMVVSAEFAAQAGVPFTDLGAFALKGVPGEQHVFAPA